MGIYSIRLPDVGEGVAEAELVEWHVKIGDTVLEDDIVGAVMTDKAAVDIPTSVTGTVTWLAGETGDIIAVGAELLRLDVDGEGNSVADLTNPSPESDFAEKASGATTQPSAASGPQQGSTVAEAPEVNSSVEPSLSEPLKATSQLHAADHQYRQTSLDSSSVESKPLAAPSVRKRARDMGVDLRSIRGSGPAGRVVHDDLDNHQIGGRSANAGKAPNTEIEDIKMVGLRRLIANKMSQAKKHIPHITIVEEIDVTSLEQTREELNASYASEKGKLTILPFVMKAITEAVRLQPVINSHYDDEAEVIRQYGGVHIGIATQTDTGLMVPVVRHCEIRNLWDSASEVARLASACRDGKAQRDELGGSTITLTSLGSLGAIATTPIINHPEVAIVGINKMVIRPHWDGQQFIPRNMMNISCSFDHRVVDGWDAAVMVQKLKTLLEKPAMLLVEA